MGWMIRHNQQHARFDSNPQCKAGSPWIQQPSFTLCSSWHIEGGKAMRTSKNLLLTLFLGGVLAGAASAQNPTQAADQTQPQVGSSTGGPVTTVDQAIDRLISAD